MYILVCNNGCETVYIYTCIEKCLDLCVVYECTRVVLGSMKCTLCWQYVLCKNGSCGKYRMYASLCELCLSVRVAIHGQYRK